MHKVTSEQHQEGGEIGSEATARVQSSTTSTTTIAPQRRRIGNGDEARGSQGKNLSTVEQIALLCKDAKINSN